MTKQSHNKEFSLRRRERRDVLVEELLPLVNRTDRADAPLSRPDVLCAKEPAMTGHLRIQLLGDFSLEYDGARLSSLNASRPQALLTYLLLHGTAPQSRRRLAFLLWPDSPEPQARSNLRNLLHTVRRLLPDADAFLLADPLTLQWNPQAPCSLDVAEFEQALLAASRAPDRQAQRTALEAALALYTGDLLPASYDDWVMSRRDALRGQQSHALHRLIDLLDTDGDYHCALDYVQRLLQQDRLDEAAYVRQMRLLARLGDRTGIRRAFQTCRDLLAHELGVEPDDTTLDAYRQSMCMALPTGQCAAPSPDSVPASPAVGHEPPGDLPADGAVPDPTGLPGTGRLPTSRTPLLGRRRELADIARLLAQSDCRLLTVAGPGGVGKTRLAVEAARASLLQAADGVAFVSLAPLKSAAQIGPAVAAAVAASVHRESLPLTELLACLQSRKLLLLLDNFEHLLDGAQFLSTILDETTDTKLLVTSRERLKLHEEWVYDVGGLPITAGRPGEDDAVALFVQSARRICHDFDPTPADQVAIRRLCRLVDGLPLGIELAAPWIRLLTCSEIADEIERSLDILATPLRNVPARHRSLRAVLDQSWALMSVEEQQVYRRLSVFRAGFAREAAAQVAGASLPILSALVDKSMLQPMSNARFGLHQLLRMYAQEKLEESGEAKAVRTRHLAYTAACADMNGGPCSAQQFQI